MTVESEARIPSMRVGACGMTESGKTKWMLETWFPRFPRMIVVDATGEWRRKKPNANAFTDSFATTIAAMTRLQHTRQWLIVATLEESAKDDVREVSELAKALVPKNAYDGYVARIGGCCLYLSELDTVMSSNYSPAPLRSLFLRGSHAGLSVLWDTQRPSLVNPYAMSQSNKIALFNVHHELDLDWVRRTFRDRSDNVLAHIRKQYHFALYQAPTGELELMDPLKVR